MGMSLAGVYLTKRGLIAHGRTSYRRIFYRGMHLTEYTSEERVSYRRICLTGLSRGRVSLWMYNSQDVHLHKYASSWACILQGVHLIDVHPHKRTCSWTCTP
jgi:hypothetical protein